jgi:hypothetical protein
MADSILRTTFHFHGTCTDLLHAAKLRHGKDGFTSPPKEGMLKILTWICLTAGGYVRSDVSDLTLAHSHSHK